MKKIPTLFVRDTVNRALVTPVVTPGCEWVLAGEGIASRKWDGTACLIQAVAPGVLNLWRRYDAKHGKTPPSTFVPAMYPDPVTGHWAGWLPIGNEPESRWHREAFDRGRDYDGNLFEPVTYELCGPKVASNHERLTEHVLIRHGMHTDGLAVVPRSFEGLRDWLRLAPIEGIVYACAASMCKIKRSDFGWPWPTRPEAS